MTYSFALSIRAQIATLSIVLVGLLVGTIAYTSMTMASIGTELDTIAHEDIPLARILSRVTSNQLSEAVNLERVLRYSGIKPADAQTSQHALQQALERLVQQGTEVETGIQAAYTRAETGIAKARSDAERKEFGFIRNNLAEINSTHANYEKHIRHALELIKTEQYQAASQLAEKLEFEEQAIKRNLISIQNRIEAFTNQAAINADKNERQALRILIIIGALAVLIGSIASFILIRSLGRGIRHTVSSVEAFASGNLCETLTTTRSDEIGQILNALETMRAQLCEMLMQINLSADGLAAASEELSVVNAQNSDGIHRQKIEMEQAATAMNEMSATVQEVARNTVQAAQAATQASNEANNGADIVKNTLNAIDKLNAEITHSSEVINALEHDSEAIGSILDVISGISEQTNLLALNAAIEAARAGEQGRGFAVVADEVRTLAGRTRASTEEIKTMIDRLQSGARNAVEAMARSKDQASLSVEQAGQTGQALKDIATSVAAISDMNNQISSAAEEQSAVAEEINRNINTINQVSEQNAEGIQETAASSAEVAQQATFLQNLILQFKTKPETARPAH